MNRISSRLRQPYPCPDRTWKTIALISLSVFAVLFVFQPFGISNINAKLRFWVVVGYGVVTALVMCLQFYLLPLLFPRFYDEKRWTVGRDISGTVVTLILVALGNIAYSQLFGITWLNLNAGVLLSALSITVAVGIIPIALLTILRQNRLLALSLRDARQLNDSLATHDGNPRPRTEERMLTLTGTGKDDLLEIPSSRLLYIESCGNYVKINYLKDNAAAQKMLRATIKQMENAVTGHPNIVKCHRAFLVNLDAVERVSGNSQGYRLALEGTDDGVPVSRAHTSAIKNKISRF